MKGVMQLAFQESLPQHFFQVPIIICYLLPVQKRVHDRVWSGVRASARRFVGIHDPIVAAASVRADRSSST
jgi:hypothetical protein